MKSDETKSRRCAATVSRGGIWFVGCAAGYAVLQWTLPTSEVIMVGASGLVGVIASDVAARGGLRGGQSMSLSLLARYWRLPWLVARDAAKMSGLAVVAVVRRQRVAGEVERSHLHAAHMRQEARALSAVLGSVPPGSVIPTIDDRGYARIHYIAGLIKRDAGQ